MLIVTLPLSMKAMLESTLPELILQKCWLW